MRNNDNRIEILLPKQSCFKEDLGDSSPVPLRFGRVESLYKNQKNIHTRYGQSEFLSKVEIIVNIYTDLDSNIEINLFNIEDKSLFKKFVIKSLPNKLTITAMKRIYDELMETINNDKSVALIKIIEYVRDLDYTYDEYCA